MSNIKVINNMKIALQLGFPYIKTDKDFINRKLATTLIPGEVYNFFIHFVDKYGNFTNGYKIDNTFPQHVNKDGNKVDGVVFIIPVPQIEFEQDRLDYIYCSVDKTAKINDIIIKTLLTSGYIINDYKNPANHMIRYYADYNFITKELSREIQDEIRTEDYDYVKNKLIDWKNRLKDRHMLSIIVVLFTIIVILGIVIYKKQTEYRQASENQYNMAFYELVDYVQNVETYLAKSLISSSPEHGAETLTHVWREANLAQAYLSRLPIDNVELEKTSKFLNQVSDYSYSLSRKNIYKKALTDEDLNNLEELHNYSVDLKNTLDQLSADINGGRIKWGELTKKGEVAFAQEVSNISKNSFSNLEENFHEYSGLIYDGAFSEHMTSSQKKGLTGDNIDEEKAKQIAIDFIGKDRVQAINFNGKSENTDIITYDFSVKVNSENEENMNISITEKGGHVLLMNYNRNVEAELISQEEADKKGKEFLESRGLNNMKETYYLKQDGIVTINYAYKQDEVTVYPDLIKLKVALDNGEIMGIETKGYLNSHEKRKIDDIKVSKEKAKEGLNKNLEIISENLAIIPTEWKTEVLCWEFKGKVNDTDFLVYINAENGKEEDILVITNTPNGTLTQ